MSSSGGRCAWRSFAQCCGAYSGIEWKKPAAIRIGRPQPAKTRFGLNMPASIAPIATSLPRAVAKASSASTGASRPRMMTALPSLIRAAASSVKATCGKHSSAAPVSTSKASSAVIARPAIADRQTLGQVFLVRSHRRRYGGFQLLDRHKILGRKGLDFGPAQSCDMADSSRDRGPCRARANGHRFPCRIPPRKRCAPPASFRQGRDGRSRPRGRDVDRFSLAGEIIGALAGNLDRRKLRWRLHDHAGIFRQQGQSISASCGRMSEVLVTGPSRSSVDRSSPQATVKR